MTAFASLGDAAGLVRRELGRPRGMAVLLAALAAMTHSFGISPALHAHHAKLSHDRSQRAFAEELDAAEPQTAALRESLNELHAAWERVDRPPPAVTDLNRDVDALLAAADRVGVRVADVAIGDLQSRDDDASCEISLSADATPAATAALLACLSADFPYIGVRRLQVTSGARRESNATQIGMRLTVVWRGRSTQTTAAKELP